MIIRRIMLSLVLMLFASVTIGVILGLDDAARSDLVSRLPSTLATPATAEPAPSEEPSASQRPTSRPATTAPTAGPTVSQHSVAPRASTKPSARTLPSSKPTAKSTQQAKPQQTAKPKPTTKPTTKAQPKKGSGTGSDPKSKSSKKKKVSPYLKGPLTKGAGGTVYLTFDDGPSPYTAKILSILSRTGSTATFFHLGVNEGGFPHADAAIRAQGSKVANHSYNHPDLTRLTAAQLRWQLRHGPRAKCFRPPYGATDEAVRHAIGKAGMRQVLWSIDTLDWTRPGVATLAKTGRLKALQNGSIVLMHDGGGDRSQTVAALPTVIADLHARGYKVRALPYC